MSNTSELRLRFAKVDPSLPFDAPVPVSVHYEEAETESFHFANPLADKALTDLRWYLEQYWFWPSGPDYDRAQEIEADLPKWGRALFDAIFQQSADAMRLFERFDGERATNSRASILTIDTTEPRILRLPWELLADQGGYLFSKRPMASIRRRMHTKRQTPIRQFELPVRILMVTCRPEGAGFIDPRSIAAPLLDALSEIEDQVEVEFLRPPTLTALDERLRDPGQPPVHIVHFDGHGVYDPGIGLGFLLFEDDKHNEHRVDAEQLGTLLNESGIPLMVLNACQSAQPDDRNPFASVAARLIESGVGGVVAMNYSVLVVTAQKLTGHFYGALAKGQSVTAALDAARRKLFADTKRFTLYRLDKGEEIIHLQDWFLPALYQQQSEIVPFPPRPAALEAPPRLSGARFAPLGRGGRRVRAGFPPEPPHGFKGRARELLTLERAFAEHHVVVLHGFGGQGKTALATHAARWLTRNGLFKRAAFVSFEGGAGLEVALAELGSALVSENFAIHEGDPVQAIADSLAETPTLIVWDNFESVLREGDVPLPAEALKALLDAGAKWAGVWGNGGVGVNGSRLLITTRDTSLPHSAYEPSRLCAHLPLGGLEGLDALELAATILEDRGLPRPPRESLSRLLDFLGGHPLSIQLVLPHLHETPNVETLIAEFDELLPGFTQGEGKRRDQSLEVSLRFSLRRLGAEAQAILPRLAVFQGGAYEEALLEITEIDESLWAKLKPELARAALIRLEDIPGVAVPYIHFHPTLVPYLRKLISAGDSGHTLSAIGHRPSAISQTRYWQAYYAFADFLYQTDSKAPLQARALAARELPNLRRAQRLAIEAGALDEAVDFAERINRFLDYFGRWRERDEVNALVAKSQIPKSQSQQGKLTKAEFLLESQRGEVLLQQGRAREAEGVFRALLARLEAGAEYEAGYDRTLTLHQLGRCLRAQGKPTAAADYYRAAFKAAEALEQDKDVRRQMGAYHTDLADVLTDLGQYAAAEQEHEAGLKLAKEVDDARQVAVVLSQLGTLALAQNNLLEARKRYAEALETFRRMGEAQHEAIYLHQLGRVAQEGRDWDEAERCYKESLSIKERLSDLAGAARTTNQLAIVAEGAGRLTEAERWYRRAIELIEQTGGKDSLLQAQWYSNLADLLLSQDRLDDSETYAHRARKIIETFDLSAEPWKNYNLLVRIAERQGNAEEARQWRRKEQETFAAFAGSEQKIKQHRQLIEAIVRAANGDTQARTQVEATFEQLIAGNWMIVDAVKRIWEGERDIDSLTEGIDRNSALIIRRVLSMLAGDQPPPHPPAANASPIGPSTAAGTTPASAQGEKTGEGEQSPITNNQSQPQGLTLPQLLELVERAAGGDEQLGGQLFPAMQQLARDPSQPPELRKLGGVLLHILIGDREVDLSGLPNELASAVRGLLGRLKRG